MSIGLFTDEVIDHFSNPRNAGEMEKDISEALGGLPDLKLHCSVL